MSAIAGIYRLDHQPLDREGLGRMLEAMSHRAPDASAMWVDGCAGLGHGMLRTTPESLRETLPAMDRSGRHVLTADARIDNREDLIRTLDVDTRAPGTITDSALILRAYERWGEGCPEHLVGDFAFAIWDERDRKLFCARDAFGVKPFYYRYAARSLFAFASEIKGLLCLPEVSGRLNETRVAQFLAGMNYHRVITFFEDVQRLPPAHILVATPEGISTRLYWSLDPTKEVRYRTADEYADAFREVFSEAVRCRLRSAFPVGAMLSGGLDSSSIACAARDALKQAGLPLLRTYSLVFDETPECDERPFINAVLEGGGFIPHFVHADQLSPLEDAERYLWHMDEPFYAANLVFQWGINAAAHREGVRVMLDGLYGDEAVSSGHHYLAELLGRGRLIALTGLLRRYSRNTGRRMRWVLKHRAAVPLIGPQTMGAWRRVRRRSRRRGALYPAPARLGLMQRALAERAGLTMPGAPSAVPVAWTAKEQHHRALIASLITHVLELEDRVTGAFAIEPRYPFLDRRLVEFCLALPSDQKFRDGWSKSILRHAMQGVLPEPIRWRVGKGYLDPWYYRALMQFEQPRLERLANSESRQLEPFVDHAALCQALRAYTISSDRASALALWEPLVLDTWLSLMAHRPRDPTTEGGAASTTIPARFVADPDIGGEGRPYPQPRTRG